MTTVNSSKLDIVTVFYADDHELLHLQGRSAQLFMDHDAIANIFVILNEEPAVLDSVDFDAIKTHYGPLADKVQLIHRSALGMDVQIDWGWRSQQVLKLLSHRILVSDYALIMDTKNHFIKACGFNDFFDHQGLPRLYYRQKYGQQLTWIKNSLAYFGNDETEPQEPHLPTITPYPVRKDVLQAVCDFVTEKSGSVGQLFENPQFNGTEFYLIYSYLHTVPGGVAKNVCNAGLMPQTLFAGWPHEDRDIERIIRTAADGHSLTFALHRNRKNPINRAQWDMILDLWRTRDLLLPSVVSFYEASPSVTP